MPKEKNIPGLRKFYQRSSSISKKKAKQIAYNFFPFIDKYGKKHYIKSINNFFVDKKGTQYLIHDNELFVIPKKSKSKSNKKLYSPIKQKKSS